MRDMRFCAARRISQWYLPLRAAKAVLPEFRAWIAERHALGESSGAAVRTLRAAIAKLAHSAAGA